MHEWVLLLAVWFVLFIKNEFLPLKTIIHLPSLDKRIKQWRVEKMQNLLNHLSFLLCPPLDWNNAKLTIILASLMKLIEFNLYSVILIIKFFNCMPSWTKLNNRIIFYYLTFFIFSSFIGDVLKWHQLYLKITAIVNNV